MKRKAKMVIISRYLSYLICLAAAHGSHDWFFFGLVFTNICKQLYSHFHFSVSVGHDRATWWMCLFTFFCYETATFIFPIRLWERSGCLGSWTFCLAIKWATEQPSLYMNTFWPYYQYPSPSACRGMWTDWCDHQLRLTTQQLLLNTPLFFIKITDAFQQDSIVAGVMPVQHPYPQSYSWLPCMTQAQGHKTPNFFPHHCSYPIGSSQ